MKIEFLGQAQNADDGGVIFEAKVDGNMIKCHFTFEALEEIDPDNFQDLPLKQFQDHKLKLLSIAENKIQRGLFANGQLSIFTSDLQLD